MAWSVRIFGFDMAEKQPLHKLVPRRSTIGGLGPWLHAAGIPVYKKVMGSTTATAPTVRHETSCSTPSARSKPSARSTPPARPIHPNGADLLEGVVVLPKPKSRPLMQSMGDSNPDGHIQDYLRRTLVENEAKRKTNVRHANGFASSDPPNALAIAPEMSVGSMGSSTDSHNRRLYDPAWNVPSAEVNHFRNFLRQYISRRRAGDVDPYSQRGLTRWGIPELFPRYKILREVLLDEVSYKTKDIAGRNALHLAAECGSVKAVEKLVESKLFHPFDATNDSNDCWLPFHYASITRSDNPAALEVLLEQSTKIIRKTRRDVKNNLDAKVVLLSMADKRGKNALHCSALYGRENILQKIIEVAKKAHNKTLGAQFIHSEDSSGCNILHFSAASGNVRLLKKIHEELEFPFNSRDKMGRTCLHYIAIGGKKKSNEATIELLDYIFERVGKDGAADAQHAFLNAKTISGKTAIAFACENGNDVVIDYILDKKSASVRTRDMYDNSPIFFAMRRMYSKGSATAGMCPVLALLKRLLPYYGSSLEKLYGENKNSIVMAACQNKQTFCLEYLLENLISHDLADAKKPSHIDYRRPVDGATALHLCAELGYLDGCRALLRHGASLTSVDNEGRTPLYKAVGMNNPEVCKLLIDHASDLLSSKGAITSYIDRPCHQGLSPFLVACALPDMSIARLLEAHGANTLARSNVGNHALHIASANDDGGAVRYLDKDLGIAVELLRKGNGRNINPFETAKYWDNSTAKAELFEVYKKKLDASGGKTSGRLKGLLKVVASQRDRTLPEIPRKIENPTPFRPLSPFARAYSAKVVKQINREGARPSTAPSSSGKVGPLSSLATSNKMKDRAYWTGPLKEKKFRFNVKRSPKLGRTTF
jgi:ankyrin repeat protein